MMVFFDSVLKDELFTSFTPNEVMLYSTLIRDSMNEEHECFGDNKFYYDIYLEGLQDYSEDGFAYIPCYGITANQQKTMSKGMLGKAYRRLKDKGWIDDDAIKVRISNIKPPFYKIPEGTGLSGRQLIVYAFLDCQCKFHGGTFKINNKYLSAYFRSTVQNVRAILTVLRRKGFIKDTKEGVTVIRPTIDKTQRKPSRRKGGFLDL